MSQLLRRALQYLASGAWSPMLEQQKIQASDKTAQDQFGSSVAISSDGDTAIVAAYGEDEVGSFTGAAYILTRSGENWTEQQKIQALDKAAGAYFGSAVAISTDGNTAIVGAERESTISLYSGAAYVFTRSGETWTQQQKIQSLDIESWDNFGGSVSISGDGDTVIVGSSEEDGVTGAAYVFTRSGSTWTQQQKIMAGDKGNNDSFAISVAISKDGNTSIVGAMGAATGGAAYIFTRSGETWTEQQKIQSSNTEFNGLFGISVAISTDGNTAIVGDKWDSAGGFKAGAAYVFTRSGSTWTQQQKIQSSDTEAIDVFGMSVCISGDGNTSAIGAWWEDTGGGDSGAVYVFTRSGETWTEQQKIQASGQTGGDWFGHVSIVNDGGTLIVGARFENTGGSNIGAAYIFTN